jgi:seryl-tRNA synthetase
MKRWLGIFLGLLFINSLVLLSPFSRNADAFKLFGKDEKGPRVIVVLVDMSGSTNRARRTVYNEAFEKIYESLGQGDRIVVGTITSRSYIDFKPVVDEEIPKDSIWVNRIQYEQNLAKTQKNIHKEVNRLLSRKKGTPYTEILNSLNIADTVFHNEKKRQKILVILSDMVQDSKEYKFDRVKVSNKYINNVIRRRQKQELIPDLSDVKIYVAGASATDSKKFRSIEKFWSRYFAATGADFSTHRYGHSLLEFEKDS